MPEGHNALCGDGPQPATEHPGHVLHARPPARTHTDVRRSAVCFAAWACLFLPWMLLYLVAGPQLLGRSLYDRLDAWRIDLASLGIGL